MKILRCDECRNYFELPPDSDERLEECRRRYGSLFILVICPRCGEQTTYWPEMQTIHDDPQLLELTPADRGIPIEYGLLPKTYEKRLRSRGRTITIDDEPITLRPLEELFEYTSVDGERYPRIYQLKGFLQTLRKVDALVRAADADLLEKGLAIGEGNGTILFVVQGDRLRRLYLFHLDGGDVEPCGLRLAQLIEPIA